MSSGNKTRPIKFDAAVDQLKKLTIADFQRMAEHQHSFDFIKGAGGKFIAVSDLYCDQLLEVSMLYQLACRVRHEDFFVIDEKEEGIFINPTRLYYDFKFMLDRNFDWLGVAFRSLRLNPYVDLFVKHLSLTQRGALKVFYLGNFKLVGRGEKLKFALSMNKMAEDIRREALSSEFKRKVSLRCDGINKNARGVVKYIEKLFGAHPKLLVLRVEFEYKKSHVGNVIFKSIKSDIAKFLRQRSKVKFFENMVGYVFKIEVRLEKGLRAHAILFFDGEKVSDDEWCANQVGDYWVNDITGGLGVSYNCSRFKGGYKGCGAGVVEYDDMQKLGELLKAAMYLTKADHWFEFDSSGEGRTIQKGQAPKSNKIKAG